MYTDSSSKDVWNVINNITGQCTSRKEMTKIINPYNELETDCEKIAGNFNNLFTNIGKSYASKIKSSNNVIFQNSDRRKRNTNKYKK